MPPHFVSQAYICTDVALPALSKGQKRALKKAWLVLPGIRSWDNAKADKHLLANPTSFSEVLKNVISVLMRGEKSANLVSRTVPHAFWG